MRDNARHMCSLKLQVVLIAEIQNSKPVNSYFFFIYKYFLIKFEMSNISKYLFPISIDHICKIFHVKTQSFIAIAEELYGNFVAISKISPWFLCNRNTLSHYL